jgi:hypothetical protein
MQRRTKQPKSRGVKNATVAGLASLGALLGAKLAKATKKKKKMQPVKFATESRVNVSAPIQSGRVHVGTQRHKPLEVSGTGLVALIGYGNDGLPKIRNPSGVDAAGNAFVLDPLGAGSSFNDFMSFPTTLRNTAANFSRYRLKKLVLNYEALDPTTGGRSVAVGVIPEVISAAKQVPLADIMQLPCHIITPSWKSFSLDALSKAGSQNGFRTEWCFLDTGLSTAESILRQECAGAFMITVVGAKPGEVVTGIDIGFLSMDYTIELDGMGPANLFVGASNSSAKRDESRIEALETALRSLQCGDSSSSSSSLPYPSQRLRSEEGTHDFHVVPQVIGRSLGACYPPPPNTQSPHH